MAETVGLVTALAAASSPARRSRRGGRAACGTGPCSCRPAGPPARTPGRGRRRGGPRGPHRSTTAAMPHHRVGTGSIGHNSPRGGRRGLGTVAWAAARARSPAGGRRRSSSTLLLLTLAGRIVVGDWSWWDLLVPALILAAQPFTEWLIHVFLLHFKPRQVGGRTIDPLVARKHRAHHADPKDAGLVFVPMPALLGLVFGLAAVLLPTMPLSRGLSALLAAYAMLFVYEWTHFLIHSSYRPRHRALPLRVAGPPQPPLPQRALLVRRHHAPGRPRAGHVPRTQRGRGVADGADARHRGRLTRRLPMAPGETCASHVRFV